MDGVAGALNNYTCNTYSHHVKQHDTVVLKDDRLVTCQKLNSITFLTIRFVN